MLFTKIQTPSGKTLEVPVLVDDIARAGGKAALMHIIHLGARDNHMELVQLALEQGTSPDLAKDDGWTPLCLAVGNGNTAVLKLLLDKGANPQKPIRCSVPSRRTEHEGMTPLDIAKLFGNRDAIKLLE